VYEKIEKFHPWDELLKNELFKNKLFKKLASDLTMGPEQAPQRPRSAASLRSS
jgi:hypothetical protein